MLGALHVAALFKYVGRSLKKKFRLGLVWRLNPAVILMKTTPSLGFLPLQLPTIPRLLPFAFNCRVHSLCFAAIMTLIIHMSFMPLHRQNNQESQLHEVAQSSARRRTK